ncbi:MAG: glycosyltransferase family 9 protein, partial [Isosphaeraceae bacterium]
ARGLAIALSGTAAEAGLTASVAAQLPNGAVNLAGRTDLGCLAALLSGAALLICNDTGVSHLADALRVPSVVISTGKNPQRWAPRDQERYQVLCRETGVLPSEVIHRAKLALSRYSGPAD